MTQYECSVCGYIHEADENWLGTDDGWKCPVCESEKSYFSQAQGVTTITVVHKYVCDVCDHVCEGDENWKETDDGFSCPVCESDKSHFHSAGDDGGHVATDSHVDLIHIPPPAKVEFEEHADDIRRMAETGEPVIEAMRTKKKILPWDDILIKGAQLHRLPLNADVPVNTGTVIGPKAEKPLKIATPVYVTHMSFGALGREIKIALAKGSAAAGTAMCSGEGGIVPESLDSSHRYILEYVPNKYSVTEENLLKVDAIEIKIGQSAKPGMGGHLPGGKVTGEISRIRGFPEGQDIISPAHFDDIKDKEELKAKVKWLRETSGGRPVGIKFAAGSVEKDLEVAVYAEPDFITIDGRPGATGASPKMVKDATSVPTQAALFRARKYLDEKGLKDISLVITGGLRTPADFAKALALGADAIAIGTAALIAAGCRQYRACNTGKCPVGFATQEESLRAKVDIDASAGRLENFFTAATSELQDFARLTGHDDVHQLCMGDLCTTNSEISRYTGIKHVFESDE